MVWLTVVVAIVAAATRFVGTHALAGIVILGAFIFAPLTLALVSSFFQRIAIRTRKLIAYSILGVVAAFPILIAAVAHPGIGLLVGFMIFAIWCIQIEIFNDLHKRT